MGRSVPELGCQIRMGVIIQSQRTIVPTHLMAHYNKGRIGLDGTGDCPLERGRVTCNPYLGLVFCKVFTPYDMR